MIQVLVPSYFFSKLHWLEMVIEGVDSFAALISLNSKTRLRFSFLYCIFTSGRSHHQNLFINCACVVAAKSRLCAVIYTFWSFGVFKNWIPLKPVLGVLTVLHLSFLSMNSLKSKQDCRYHFSIASFASGSVYQHNWLLWLDTM